jgi:hypothetical protein
LRAAGRCRDAFEFVFPAYAGIQPLRYEWRCEGKSQKLDPGVRRDDDH